MPIHSHKQRGFTLTELMVTVAVIAILSVVAIPSFIDMIQGRRVKGAAEGLAAALQNAKAEAIKTNSTVRIVFTPAGIGADHTTWCYGMTDQADCDCTAADSCAVGGVTTGTVIPSTEFKDVSANFSVSNMRSFTPLRGGSNGGTVTFSGPGGKSLGVAVNSIGRIRICKPDGSALAGYVDSGACP